jgi:HAD superfamily hydrolase (TIGR01509 family)
MAALAERREPRALVPAVVERAEPARAKDSRRATPPRTETAVATWLSAFASADRAIRRNADRLRPPDARERIQRLHAEQEHVAALLETISQGQRGATLLIHCLRRQVIDSHVLGLPNGVSACIFDLEGALTTSAAVHRDAWSTALDSFLVARADGRHRDFVPFDPRLDYATHLDGKPRLVGLRAFLASRGINLPEGEPSDVPGTDSVYGLANRKQELWHHYLEQRGVEAFEGSRAYLELARVVGVHRAVVSASANTSVVLQRAGITELVEARVDGQTIEAESLRPEPFPDMLLAACARLGVDPAQAAVFETTPAGITAARAAGAGVVVAVARDQDTSAFSASDADVVVHDLGELLEHSVTPRRTAPRP